MWRMFARGFVVAVAFCGISLSGKAIAAPPPPGESRPPNIVLIVADDLGWNGVSYHNGFAATPNIDRIASRGVELDRFYVSPMCTPTRAGLLTGRYPIRFGMARTVVHPWSYDGLPPAERTLPEALAQAGYRHRALFGKWHLGHMDPKWHPLPNGFTQFEGCYTGAIDYFKKDRVGEVDWHDGYADSDESGYVTDVIADTSVAFITAHAKDAPFFCYTAFTAPHEPAEAPQAYLDRYAGLDDNPGDGKPSSKQATAAATTAMDDGIGRILAAVEQAGIADQTLVFFFSDNGGIAAIPGSNDPLRGAKFTVYEGGVRVPAAAWWPGHIEGGRKVETPAMNIDVMPTLLALAGGPAASTEGSMDGLDISRLLLDAGAAIQPRELCFFMAQWGPDKEQIAVTSAEGWKLVVIGPDIRGEKGFASPDHQVELYRLSEDPLEQHNLADREPERVKQLGARLIAFRRSEAEHPMNPINKKPPDFHAPKHWHNAPGGPQ